MKNVVLDKGIVVEVKKDEVGIRVLGHSGVGRKGSDIVCAAVSAIVQTSIMAITRVAKIHQKLDQGEGFLESSIIVEDAEVKSIGVLKVILSTMMIGLEEIAHNYPDSIEINYR